jgi:hypothetical protein
MQPSPDLLSTSASIYGALVYLARRNATWKLSSPVPVAYGCPHQAAELRRKAKDTTPAFRHCRLIPVAPYFSFRPRA